MARHQCYTSGSDIKLSASSLGKQQRELEWKNVYFSLLCSKSVLRLLGLARLHLLLWLWLSWLQTSTSLCVFAVYALVLIILDILKNVCVLCKGASCGEFLFHWLSSHVFQMTGSHQAYVSAFASLQLLRRKISEPLGRPEQTYSNIYISRNRSVIIVECNSWVAVCHITQQQMQHFRTFRSHTFVKAKFQGSNFCVLI